MVIMSGYSIAAVSYWFVGALPSRRSAFPGGTTQSGYHELNSYLIFLFS